MERQVIGQNRAKVMSDYIMWDKYENIVAINKRNGRILFTTKSYIEQQISKPVELNISHLEYLITDILDIKVQSETSRKVTTTVNNGRVTTSGTSMVSRALVGSLLLGPAGMIIGAATAKKNQGKSTSSSNIVESTLYSLLIFIRNEEPVVFASSYNQAIIENLQLQMKDFISKNSDVR